MDPLRSPAQAPHAFAAIDALVATEQHHEAETILLRLSADGPNAAEARRRLGAIARSRQDFETAAERYMGALNLRPDWADCHGALGQTLLEAGRLEEAVESLQKALTLDPNQRSTRLALARFYGENGLWQQAVRLYAELIPQDPNAPEVYSRFGECCLSIGDHALAEKAFFRALQLGDDSSRLLFALGVSRLRSGHPKTAIDLIQKSLLQNPFLPHANFTLAKAYRQIGNFDAAQATLCRELEVNPDCSLALMHLGVIHQSQRRIGQAIQCYKRAIASNPFHPVAPMNHALLALLATNNRIRANRDTLFWDCEPELPIDALQPEWDGGNINGGILLLRSNLPTTDAIALLRYIPLVAAHNGRVAVQCHPLLKRLMKTVPGVAQVFSTREPQPRHDLQAPLAGLTRILGPKLEMSLADRSPHLAPALETNSIPRPDRSEKIRIGFAGVDSDPNSILCDRPLDLGLWTPLLNVEGCEWVDLQSSNTPDDLPEGLDFRGLPTKYPDFLDAAAVIQELDLIISLDCPVAHLAATMEKPVWLILPALTDWKWATKRGPDSWYPTMRLFRESETEGRRRLISELAACLSALIAPVVADVEDTEE
ncbi:MAG: tetratricopeptide repeat protein [Verrucomicrobia bacterium]|nr:tetratricopeptide repeat protein [Verrucomicrobiota bacterium]